MPLANKRHLYNLGKYLDIRIFWQQWNWYFGVLVNRRLDASRVIHSYCYLDFCLLNCFRNIQTNREGSVQITLIFACIYNSRRLLHNYRYSLSPNLWSIHTWKVTLPGSLLILIFWPCCRRRCRFFWLFDKNIQVLIRKRLGLVGRNCSYVCRLHSHINRG